MYILNQGHCTVSQIEHVHGFKNQGVEAKGGSIQQLPVTYHGSNPATLGFTWVNFHRRTGYFLKSNVYVK